MADLVMVRQGDTDLTNAKFFTGLSDGDIINLEAGGWRKFVPAGEFTMSAGTAGIFDFSTAPESNPGARTNLVQLSDGWEWTVNADATNAYLVWNPGAIFGQATEWSFDLEATRAVDGTKFRARRSANSALTSNRGLDEPISFAAAGTQSKSYPLSASGENLYLGLYFSGTAVGAATTFRIRKPKLTKV